MVQLTQALMVGVIQTHGDCDSTCSRAAWSHIVVMHLDQVYVVRNMIVTALSLHY